MKTYTTPTYGLDLTDEYNEGWLDSNDFIVTLKSHGVRIEKSTSAGTATLDLTEKILYFSLSQVETARLGKGYVKVELTCKKSNLVGKSNTDEFYLDDAIRKELETATTTNEKGVHELKHRTVTTSSGEVRIIEPKMPKVKIEPYTPKSVGTNDHDLLINRDHDNSHPISAITGLESALNTKYTKPSSGIPASDMESSVQTSLGKADSAYQKPSTGIAKTDLASDVRDSLTKADTALQSSALTPYRTSANQDTIDAAKADLVSGKVPSSQLPSYVDDVIEVQDYAHLPATGESGKIYVTIDTNKQYRWTGTQYVQISESLALGETSSTAHRGDHGKTAYEHSQSSGNPHGTTATDVGAYVKPSSGIPKTDMSSDVQTSLGKADSALQTHQSLADYRKSAYQDTIDATKQPKYTVTTSTSGTVNLAQDNTVVIDGTPTKVAVTLPAPTSGKDYECGLIFTAGTGIAVSETAPSGYTIEYADADTPTFTAGKTYEILYRCLFNGKISAKYAVI